MVKWICLHLHRHGIKSINETNGKIALQAFEVPTAEQLGLAIVALPPMTPFEEAFHYIQVRT